MIQARCYQITDQDDGRVEQAKRLFGLVTGGVVSYFKLGEGGWSPSAEVTSDVATTDGSKTVSGTIPGTPVVPRTVTMTSTPFVLFGTLTDTVTSPYDGTGALVHPTHGKIGVINYKTGVFSATYPNFLAGGQAVSCVRKHWGQVSGPKVFEIAEGDGGQVYAGTVDCHPIQAGTVRVTDGNSQVLTDDGVGGLSGDGTGTVDYDTGLVSVDFTSNVPGGQFVTVVANAEGVPMPPEAGAQDLGAVTQAGLWVPSLFTFSKTFVPGSDMSFLGVGTRTVRITMSLLAAEANDDGNGEAPFFTEGGLFSANDTMLAYFTFPGISKTGSSTWQREMDFVV